MSARHDPDAAAEADAPAAGEAGPAAAPAVACEAVSVRYGGVEAVREATLTVPKGEVHVLLGASGSGKTTLLRAIAGLERVCEGRIALSGRVVEDAGRGGEAVPPEDRGLGFVFQDYALFPHLDVAANVAFGRGADRARAAAALANVGLADLAGRLPAELSGGQQQRVALARALAVGPSVLLLDEPFSGIDERLRRALRAATLDVIRGAGVTAIFVTHAVDEAFAIGDRLSVMEGGRILQTGTPDALYHAPTSATVALAVGDACLVPATLTREPGVADGALGRLAVKGPGDVTEDMQGHVVIRPETVRVHSKDAPAGALTARIVRRTFLGARFELELRVGSEEGVLLRAHVPGAFGPAETVSISLDGPLPWVPEA
jgi:iron(III) transport system ATP-binding protein